MQAQKIQEYSERRTGHSKKSADAYIGSTSFEEYMRYAKLYFPVLTDLIDEQRVTGARFRKYVSKMNDISWEFEGSTSGGRGAAYNIAQKNVGNRRIGIISLLKCFSENLDVVPGRDKRILDALGGNGTIARFLNAERTQAPNIISSDLSSYMVKSCLSHGLPCIRQSATDSLLKDSSLDGVLIAYGSHHLNVEARKLACAEAYRTVKNGGRLVLHDFEIGTPSAAWFDEVVHPYSRTGHPHLHFTKREMHDLLYNAGFRNIGILNIDDSFVLEGESEEKAKENALMHLYHMYDLVKIANDTHDVPKVLERTVRDTLGEIEISQSGTAYVAKVPRQAIVAVGTKVT